MRHPRTVASKAAFCLLPAMLVGCQPLIRAEGEVSVREEVPVRGDVDIRSPEPIQAGVHMTQPVPVSGGLQLQGPINVTLQGGSVAYEGTFISEEMMNIVKEDQTTGEYVLAVFGEPDARATLQDGTEIWRWTYRPVRDQGSLVRLFGGENEEPRPEHITAFVRLRDGLVIEKWRG